MKIKKNKISKNFIEMKLSDITEVKDGTHDSPKYVKEGIPFITSKNLFETFIDFKNVKYIKKEDHEKFYKRSNVKKNDILFGMIGTIGNPTIVYTDDVFSIKNVALIKENSILKSNLIKVQLKNKNLKKQIKSLSAGGVLSFLKLSDVRGLLLKVPAIEDQEKIDNILVIIENNIEDLKTLLEKIEIRNQYYADKLLSGEYTIEDNKIIKNCSELKEVIANGVRKMVPHNFEKTTLKELHYKTKKGHENQKGYLEIGDINVETKDYDISNKDKLTVPSCRFCEKDILLISTVRPQRLGITITKEDLFISNAFATIDIKKNRIVEYVVKTNDFMNYISQNSEGGIYPTIKEFKLLEFEFFYDKSKNEMIYNFLQSLSDEYKQVLKLLSLEEKRFEWLSDKLLSGEYIIED